ncbi:Imm26 family immunity protein [Rufibacter roseus]|uniref:Imm26 family immunity protein n=1 Tax=Rufibacter roseus TaxID=1567108 RepID=A0ABW2DNE9_9BACT|nr:Imm26 family immunity protein [Rufibacter roseus]
MAKQKEIPGGIIQIGLGSGQSVYGRILNHGDVAIYDFLAEDELTVFEELLKFPIIFKGVVNDSGVKRGRWQIVEVVPLEESLKNSKYFIEEIGNPDLFKIIENGHVKYGCRKEECYGLYVGGAWAPERVEEVVRDHFSGRENPYIKMYYAPFRS